MIQYKRVYIGVAALLALGLAWGIVTRQKPMSNPRPAVSSPVCGKKAVWINSYHAGYTWSDTEYSAAEQHLSASGVQLKQIFLDAKRNTSDAYGMEAAKQIKSQIDDFSPDVIIAADDPAQKYLIVPFYRGGSIPVVFCGVNWSTSEYGYPAPNITGMIEVELMTDLVRYLSVYAKGTRIAYVAVDDISERKIAEQYNTRFFNGMMTAIYATGKQFADFCAAFESGQQAADVIILGGNGGILDWNDAVAIPFFLEHTRKPTGTANPWMVKYALVAYSRMAEEQGQWAAAAALRILGGTAPASIPITENRIGKLYINLDIAERMDIVFSPALLKQAEVWHSQ